MKRIYLDYAATTPVDPAVAEEILPYLSEFFGNPMSIHSHGQKARGAVEKARRTIALMIGAYPDEIVFTSGGTESNNTAVKGTGRKSVRSHIITSAVEHHSVMNACRSLEKEGLRVSRIPVDRYGLVDPDEVEREITDDTSLISIMHANNEIGTVEPIEEIGGIAKQRGIPFHTDAVQTFGHLPIDVNRFGIDLLSASAHKLYGPKGAGFLYIRRNTSIEPYMHGGDQENGFRASTHNVPGIVGLGTAARIAGAVMEEEAERLTALRNRLIRGILSTVEGSALNGHPARRLPNNVNVSLGSVEGESVLLSLDLAGIACSTGSACSFATVGPSHVLHAIGAGEGRAQSSVRLTIGRYTAEEDIDRVLEILPRIVSRLRSSSSWRSVW